MEIKATSPAVQMIDQTLAWLKSHAVLTGGPAEIRAAIDDDHTEALSMARSKRTAWIEAMEAVNKLDSLDVSDPEKAHGQADAIIFGFLPLVVADAYMRLQERSP